MTMREHCEILGLEGDAWGLSSPARVNHDKSAGRSPAQSNRSALGGSNAWLGCANSAASVLTVSVDAHLGLPRYFSPLVTREAFSFTSKSTEETFFTNGLLTTALTRSECMKASIAVLFSHK